MVSNKTKGSFYNKKTVQLFYILLICFCSGHALQTIKTSLQLFVIPAALLLSGPILNELFNKKLNLHSTSALLFVVMIACTAFLYFPSASFTYFLLVFIVLTAFGITCVYSFDNFIRCYLYIMTGVTIIALIGYYLVNNTSVLSFLPTYNNVNDVEYKVGLIFNYITIVPDRNCGMFWEPGLFATNLIFSLVFEIAFKKTRPSILRIILFASGIITANSSAGFILCVFCIWLLIIKGRKNSLQSAAWKFFSFVMFTAGVVLVLNLDSIIMETALGDNEYVTKLISDNVANSSRAQAILHNLEIFVKNPIFGAGYTNVAQQMKYTADTSSSTYILSVFGSLGILYTFFWIYGVVKIKELNFFSKVIISIIFVMIINKESHLTLLFSWILLFYLLKNCSIQKENEKNAKNQENIIGQR